MSDPSHWPSGTGVCNLVWLSEFTDERWDRRRRRDSTRGAGTPPAPPASRTAALAGSRRGRQAPGAALGSTPVAAEDRAMTTEEDRPNELRSCRRGCGPQARHPVTSHLEFVAVLARSYTRAQGFTPAIAATELTPAVPEQVEPDLRSVIMSAAARSGIESGAGVPGAAWHVKRHAEPFRQLVDRRTFGVACLPPTGCLNSYLETAA